jgi:hypothetical protein
MPVSVVDSRCQRTARRLRGPLEFGVLIGGTMPEREENVPLMAVAADGFLRQEDTP